MGTSKEKTLDELLDLNNVIRWYERLYQERPYPPHVEAKAQNMLDFAEEWFPEFDASPLVLDYGCGNGRDFPIWHELGFNVIGADPSPKGVELASQNEYGFPIVWVDGRNIPFADQSFDILAACGVLMHVRSDLLVKLEREFWRVVKDDGYLFIRVWSARRVEEVNIVRIDNEYWHEPKPLKLRLPEYYEDLFDCWNRINELKGGWRGWLLLQKVVGSEHLLGHDNVMKFFGREYQANPRKAMRRAPDSMVEFCSRWLPYWTGFKVLDYGCGNGPTFAAWNELDFDVVGMDSCSVAAELARVNEFGFDIIQNDGKTVPLGDGSIDLVACISVMHHILPKTQRALEKEFWRVLKVGGHLLLVGDVGKQDLRRRYDMTIPEKLHPPEFYRELLRRWRRVDTPRKGWKRYLLFQKGSK